jgi:hypothetical protein
MISGQWNGNDVKESDRGLIWGSIPTFAWRDWGNVFEFEGVFSTRLWCTGNISGLVDFFIARFIIPLLFAILLQLRRRWKILHYSSIYFVLKRILTRFVFVYLLLYFYNGTLDCCKILAMFSHLTYPLGRAILTYLSQVFPEPRHIRQI